MADELYNCNYLMVALHPEGVDRNRLLEMFTRRIWRVALHPEGVDRNNNPQVVVVPQK